MINDEAVDRFITTVGSLGAEIARVETTEQLNAELTKLLGDTTTIYCPGETSLEKAVDIAAERREQDYIQAEACVEEVFGAIAETGSLVCSSIGGKTVQAGLLPSHHVAIVSSGAVYETLDDFFSTCPKDSMPANITFETGPSRTADIELTLTIGVHGPERLSIIVVSN